MQSLCLILYSTSFKLCVDGAVCDCYQFYVFIYFSSYFNMFALIIVLIVFI